MCPVETCFRHKHPFSSKSNLQQHIHSLHSGRPYSCDKCSRSFGLRYRCVAHKLECGFKFECNQCKNTFPSSQALELHCRRSGHSTKSAQQQMRESNWLPVELLCKKQRNRKEKPVLRPGEERIHTSNVLSSLLINHMNPRKKLRSIRKKKYFKEVCTQTDVNHIPLVSISYSPAPPLYHPFAPPLLLHSDTQTQSQSTLSHTESIQTNFLQSHPLPTEHAEVQTLLSRDSWSPEWPLFSHTPSDNLFDFGTQTYENLLGHELGLIDSSCQTYL